MDGMSATDPQSEDYAVVPRGFAADLISKGQDIAGLAIGKGIQLSDDPIVVKGDDVTFTGTGSQEDRDHDIIQTAGVLHDDWEKHPAFFFSHDPRIRLGRGRGYERIGRNWAVTTRYYTERESPFAAQVKAQLDFNLENKALKDHGAAYSVGFIALESSWNDDRGGIDFKSISVLEYSDVGIPANPGALLRSKAAGVPCNLILDWAESVRKESGLVSVNAEFAQKLIELIDPAKGLTVVELTPAHLKHLSFDRESFEKERELEALSDVQEADLANFGIRAARLGATDQQISELAEAAGLDFKANSGACVSPVASAESAAAGKEEPVDLTEEEKDELAVEAFIDVYAAKFGHLPEEL